MRELEELKAIIEDASRLKIMDPHSEVYVIWRASLQAQLDAWFSRNLGWLARWAAQAD